VQRWRLGWRPGSPDLVLSFVTPMQLIPRLLARCCRGGWLRCLGWRDFVRGWWTAVLSFGQFLGFWLLGAWAAALVTFVESLLRSVRIENF
jgi:hypothetical protein